MSDETVNIYKRPPLGIRKDGSRYKAVIVDDSATVRQFLRQILLSVDFDVRKEFDNGGAVVAEYIDGFGVPDFMFVDVEMPVMNGVEVVRKLRPIMNGKKIVMITSNSEKYIVDELLKAGVDGYITKPFDRDKILISISRLTADR